MDCELKRHLFDASAISERIREARGELTQRDLAERCYLSQGVISLYENGRIPETPSLFAICEVLGVSAYWIMYGDSYAKYMEEDG